MSQDTFDRGNGNFGTWVGFLGGVGDNTVFDDDGPSTTPENTVTDGQFETNGLGEGTAWVGGELDVCSVLNT